jgi:hypothetical protein
VATPQRNAREQTRCSRRSSKTRVVLDCLPPEPATIRVDEVVAQLIAQAGSSATAQLATGLDRCGDATVDGDGRVLHDFWNGGRRHRPPCQDGATVELRVSREDRWICLALSSSAGDADWTESDLFELRVATLMAAVFRGSLQLLATPGSAALTLQLPEAARAR